MPVLSMFTDRSVYRGNQYMRAKPGGKVHQLLQCLKDGCVVQKLTHADNKLGFVPFNYLMECLTIDRSELMGGLLALTRLEYLLRQNEHHWRTSYGQEIHCYPGWILTDSGTMALEDLDRGTSVHFQYKI